MKHREDTFKGAGGCRIFWQAWLPDGEARAVVGLAHGVSEHSGRYAWVAEQFVERGYAFYALDHRGHGKSEGSRAVVDRVEHAIADIGTLLGLGSRESGDGAKPFLLGHSMGGMLSIGFAARRQSDIQGLMLSAPLAVLDAAPAYQRLIGHALSIVAPSLGVIAIDSDTVSRDPEVVKDYDADPLNYRGKLPARTVHEMAAEVGRFESELPKITIPLLVQMGTGDRLVPPRAAQFVYGQAGSEDKTLKTYEGLYHEILNEPERAEVLQDTLDWLDLQAKPGLSQGSKRLR